MPASSSASLMASSASRFSDRSIDLANSVCPTPTIAVRSRITLAPSFSQYIRHRTVSYVLRKARGWGSTVHRERVEGDDALREDEERVDVELRELIGVVDRQALHFHDRVDEGFDVALRSPARPFQQRGALHLV